MVIATASSASHILNDFTSLNALLDTVADLKIDPGDDRFGEEQLRSRTLRRFAGPSHGVARATFASPDAGATRTGPPSVRIVRSPRITRSEPSIGVQGTSPVAPA